jgi:uridine kinase
MKKAIVIGIAGGSGSGKTLVAKSLLKDLGSDRVFIMEQDDYYKDLSHLPLENRADTNFDHPDSIDEDLMVWHLQELILGHPIETPLYDFKTHCRLPGTRRIEGHLIIILEGILILDNSRLRELMDIKVFVDTDADLRFIRRLKRDILERGRTMESVISRYLDNVRPMHLEFVEPSKRHADIIIPEGGHNFVAIDLLKTKIKALLKEKDQ